VLAERDSLSRELDTLQLETSEHIAKLETEAEKLRTDCARDETVIMKYDFECGLNFWALFVSDLGGVSIGRLAPIGRCRANILSLKDAIEQT